MDAFRERLNWLPGTSVAFLDRRLEDGIPFQWHHHPEFELTLTLNSAGQRFIGDHCAPYESGDLVLVGPNLPHTWVSACRPDQTAPHIALVIWFSPAWGAELAHNFKEFSAVEGLLRRGTCGLQFDPHLANGIKSEISAFFGKPPAERALTLMRILGLLANANADSPLSSRPADLHETAATKGRMDRVLDHIHQHYRSPLSLEDLSNTAALSVSGLHRLFKRNMGQNISDYVTALRLGEACARLAGSTQPIAHIASDVGYPSLANFNRQFRKAHHQTPREYRLKHQNHP
ncbi:MAG: AraC family transcriptional regulator [Pseudoruegeria sp.]